MRTRIVIALLAGVCTLAGCSGVPGTAARAGGATGSSGSSGSSSGSACEEVVAGIDAFNRQEFDQTVAHFKAAVPLAEAEDDGTPAAEQLLEAVEYYAELPAEEYLTAAATSPEFAKYKQITLGQCASDSGPVPPSPSDPGQQV